MPSFTVHVDNTVFFYNLASRITFWFNQVSSISYWRAWNADWIYPCSWPSFLVLLHQATKSCFHRWGQCFLITWMMNTHVLIFSFLFVGHFDLFTSVNICFQGKQQWWGIKNTDFPKFAQWCQKMHHCNPHIRSAVYPEVEEVVKAGFPVHGGMQECGDCVIVPTTVWHFGHAEVCSCYITSCFSFSWLWSIYSFHLFH